MDTVKQTENGDFSGPIKEDYQANNALIGVYVKLRFSVVLLSVTALAIPLASVSSWQISLSTSITTLVLVYLAIRMVGAINKNVYARCLYGAVLEEEMGYRGFFSCWERFLERNPQAASSHAFVIAARAVNALASILICTSAVYAYEDVTALDYNTRLVLALIFLVGNEYYIRTELNETHFLPRLYTQMRDCRAFTNLKTDGETS